MGLASTVQAKVSSLTGSNRSYLTDGSETVVMSTTNSFSFSMPNLVTSYTVEDGSQTSDHARVQSETLSVSATLTDDEGSFSGFLEKSRSEKREQLKKWRDERTILEFITPEDTFESCVIESLDRSKSEPVVSDEYSITLKQFRISKASQRNVALPQRARPTNRAGRAQTQTESVPGQPANRSLARSLF